MIENKKISLSQVPTSDILEIEDAEDHLDQLHQTSSGKLASIADTITSDRIAVRECVQKHHARAAVLKQRLTEIMECSCYEDFERKLKLFPVILFRYFIFFFR